MELHLFNLLSSRFKVTSAEGGIVVPSVTVFSLHMTIIWRVGYVSCYAGVLSELCRIYAIHSHQRLNKCMNLWHPHIQGLCIICCK